MRILARHYKDQEIIAILRDNTSKKHNQVIRFLYKKCFKAIQNHILNNNGNEEDASDIFQEAITLFYQQIQLGKFEGRSAITTYLQGIAKNLWFSQLRKHKKINTQSIDESLPESQEDHQSLLKSQQSQVLFKRLFSKMKEDCQKILKLAYYENLSMAEISEQFESLTNEQSARTKKYRCLKGLMSIFKKNSISIDHFN